jgi:hypothetical protein
MGWSGAGLKVVFNTEGKEFTEIGERRQGEAGGDHEGV